MATNKNAQIRYKALDKCFRNPGKKYFWEDLLEECNIYLSEYNGEQSSINRRQLFYDINFMESESGWSIPLKRNKEGRRIYYRYEDLDYSINNQPLNETELNQLQQGMLILSRFQGLPQLQELQEIIPRLQKGSSPDSLQPAVSFDENPYLKGAEYIGSLFNSIMYKEVLEISYQDFNAKEPYKIIFHPYHLKQYNNRWFVFGFNAKEEKTDWILALDRILSINTTKSSYKENNEIDWNDYFEDIIGVSKPDDVELVDITLWVAPSSAKYVLTKPLHGSQKKKKFDDEGLIIELNLIPNFEFFQTVLSFGNRMKIISPDHLVKEVINTLKKSLSNYTI